MSNTNSRGFVQNYIQHIENENYLELTIKLRIFVLRNNSSDDIKSRMQDHSYHILGKRTLNHFKSKKINKK